MVAKPARPPPITNTSNFIGIFEPFFALIIQIEFAERRIMCNLKVVESTRRGTVKTLHTK